jgi:hypothetical protein
MPMSRPAGAGLLWALVVPVIFAAVALQCPLNSALTVGGDDGYELNKALLLSRDPQAAVRMWNDQPWLHTLLTAQLFKWVGEQAAVPRLFSLMSAMALVMAVGHLIRKDCGRLELMLVGALLLSAWNVPGLAMAAMLELPAIAWAVVAAAVAYCGYGPVRWWRLVLCGAVVGAASQIKWTAMIVMPALVVMLVCQLGWRKAAWALVLWLVGFGVVVAAIAVWSPSFDPEQLFLSHLKANMALQGADRAVARFRFDTVLQNPAMVVAAGLGIWRGWKWVRPPAMGFGLTFLTTAAAVAVAQRPWWNYYVLHFYVPLAMFGAVGAGWAIRAALRFAVEAACSRPKADAAAASGAVGLLGAGHGTAVAVLAAPAIVALWVGFSVLNVVSELAMVRSAKRADQLDIVRTMREFAPQTRWCFAAAREYAFAARVLVPPELVVLPWKRFLSGNITKQDVAQMVMRYEPEQILLNRYDWLRTAGFESWLTNTYVLTDRDELQELWVKRSLNPPELGTRTEMRLRALGL